MDHIRRGRISFEGEEWERVSHSAKDLLSCLLVVNASQRIALDTVIKHPWLLPDTAPATPLHTSNSLQKLGLAENSINYTLHAYHQATKVGVVLGDPSRAPLVRKRKQKAESATMATASKVTSDVTRPTTLHVHTET